MAVHSLARVDSLFADLLEAYDHHYGFGAMTCSVYDTAWVANVTKTVVGIPQYLFPSAFIFVLDAQLPDGSWNAHYHPDHAAQSNFVSPNASSNLSDSILSTMAALYTLSIHAISPHQIRPARIPAPSLPIRITRATASLERMLRVWRVDTCNSVGFEILTPALLDLLTAQGYDFDFPDRATLLKIRAAKMHRVRPAMLYQMAPVALLHSLEAFHGWTPKELDVSKLKHHMVRGSMMASPAATASYLIKSQTWDDEAEAYLRMAIECGDGNGSGGVPSAWPSTYFEMLWVASTLLEAGLGTQTYNGAPCELILAVIDEARSTNGGLVGFSPGIEPDLDDSAKASIVLSLSGKLGFSKDIARIFDAPKCLKTYPIERDPSISANCNALLSIVLDRSDYPSKGTTIEKIVNFICDSWIDTEGSIKDKWNLSPFYPAMLMVRSLAELLCRLKTARLPQIAASVISGKVVTVLTDCLARTLKSQHSDGSWGSIGPREETAYAVLTLASLLSTPVVQSLRGEMVLALKRGRKSLLGLEGGKPEHIWVEKVTYGSKYLAEAYVVAAMFTSVDDSGGYGVGEFCHLKACKEDNLALDPDGHNVGRLLVLRDCLAKPESG